MPDLTVVFQILSFACAILALHVMQQTLLDSSSTTDPWWLQVARRMGFVFMICGLAWNISYHDTRELPATWPEYLIVIGLIFIFGVRAIILFHHRHDHRPIHRNHHVHH